MKTLTVKAPFDPVSEAEIRHVLVLAKSGGYGRIFLKAEGEGVLSEAKRTELLKKAVRPWRRLRAARKKTSGEVLRLDPLFEKEVREGRYDLAAHGIRRILIEEGLYLEATVDAMCSPHRAAHSRSVAAVCERLAKAHGMDAAQARKAGMVHDLTKGMPDEYNRNIVRVRAPEILPMSPKVYHSYSAPVWLYGHMGLRDRKILKAVWHHTLGDGSGPLDHILYIADKTEPLRGYDASKQLEAAEKDLAAGAAMVREESRQYLKEKEGIDVHV